MHLSITHAPVCRVFRYDAEGFSPRRGRTQEEAKPEPLENLTIGRAHRGEGEETESAQVPFIVSVEPLDASVTHPGFAMAADESATARSSIRAVSCPPIGAGERPRKGTKEHRK